MTPQNMFRVCSVFDALKIIQLNIQVTQNCIKSECLWMHLSVIVAIHGYFEHF